MSDIDVPTLEVGFAIDFSDSFGQLGSLDDLIGTASANAVREFQKVEAATKGVVNLSGATAQITTFGGAASRELANVARDTNRAERAGESMVRQLQRQIEVFGKSASEIRDMRAEMRAVEADSRGLTELATRLREANAEMKRLEDGTKGLPGPSNSARAATQNLGFQVQDFAVQIIGGTDALRAFAMQAPQAAGAMTGFEGKLGSVGAFLNGPWGIAITLGITLLAGFADKLHLSGDAIDDQVEKLKKQALETETTRAAQERFKGSAEGVAAAIRDSEQASKDWVKALDTAAVAANKVAWEQLNAELKIRRTTVAALEQAKELAEQKRVDVKMTARGDVVNPGFVAAAQEVERLQAELDKHNEKVRKAENYLNFTRIDLAAEKAALLADPVGKINAAFDEQVRIVKRAAEAHASAGKVINDSLTQELAAIERSRNAAVKAEEDRQRAAKETQTQIGRTITLMEARQIAEKAGGRITSDLRSHEKQQELYDKYVAYKNGTGPWAALAAKPGTSNHERGLALDVAKTDGMTLKKLVAAYRAAGVKLTEALDEGSHFHIAWAVGKVVADAEKAADKVAEWVLDARAQANGNVWSLLQAVDQRNQAWDDHEFTDKVGTFGDNDKEARDRVTDQADRWRKDNEDAITAVVDALKLVEDHSNRAADAMANAFGRAGAAIGDAAALLVEYGNRQDVIDKQAALGMINQAEARKATFKNQVEGFGAISGAAKGLFKEHSKGYQAMAAAEKAFAIVQLAGTAVDVARGAAKMFSSLGPFAFPAVAAMVGVMASFGFKGGGKSGGGFDLKAYQAAQGTGSVLGDNSAKSDSIAHALELMAANSDKSLEYSNAMLRSLRAIETNIGSLSGLLARQLSISGGAFDTSGLGLGSKTSSSFDHLASGALGMALGTAVLGPLGGLIGAALGGITKFITKIPVIGGLIGGIGNALFGKKVTKTLQDQGILFNPETIQSILENGIDGRTYQTIKTQTKKKTFGITTSNKTKVKDKFGLLDDDVEQQVGMLIGSMRDGILSAAGVLGIEGAAAVLDAFKVDLGKISLKDLKGSEIQEQLNAIFSKLGDNMADAAIPGLEAFQKVGEGAFETLMRLTKDYQTIDVQMQSIGRTFGMTGAASVELRENLIALFGSLDDLVDQTQFYRENFLTAAEQIAPIQQAVTAELSRLGLSSVNSIEKFKAVVNGLDLTTAAGQSLYAALMALAPGFSAVEKYEQEQVRAAQEAQQAAYRKSVDYRQLEIQIMEASGNALGAIASKRRLEWEATDESLRGMLETVWYWQDRAEAEQKAAQELVEVTNRFKQFADELRSFRDELDGSAGGGLTYRQAMAKLMATGGLAAAGDETALAGLSGVGREFLSLSKASAESALQYQRDVALVRGYLNQAIAAADGGAGVATSGIGSFTGTPAAIASTAGQANVGIIDAVNGLRAEVAAQRAEVRAANEALVIANNKMARLQERWDRGGAVAVATDDDTPLNVEVA